MGSYWEYVIDISESQVWFMLCRCNCSLFEVFHIQYELVFWTSGGCDNWLSCLELPTSLVQMSLFVLYIYKHIRYILLRIGDSSDPIAMPSPENHLPPGERWILPTELCEPYSDMPSIGWQAIWTIPPSVSKLGNYSTWRRSLVCFSLPVRQSGIASVNFVSREWCKDMAVYVIDLFQFAFETVWAYFSLVSAFSQKNKTYKVGLGVCVCLCLCVCVCVCLCKILGLPLTISKTVIRLIRNFGYIQYRTGTLLRH